MNREELLKTLEVSREAIIQYQEELESSDLENDYDRELIKAIAKLQLPLSQLQCSAIGPCGPRCDCCGGSGRKYR